MLLKRLYAYNHFGNILFQNMLSVMYKSCSLGLLNYLFGVHARVHGFQNSMKIEVSQQFDFRRENDRGT